MDCMHDQPHLSLAFYEGDGTPHQPDRSRRGPLGAHGDGDPVARLVHGHGGRRGDCSGRKAADLAFAAFGDHGTREFFTHVRFHKHNELGPDRHPLLVELYARSSDEASDVLAAAARGNLELTSLAEESRPPAAGADDDAH